MGARLSLRIVLRITDGFSSGRWLKRPLIKANETRASEKSRYHKDQSGKDEQRQGLFCAQTDRLDAHHDYVKGEPANDRRNQSQKGANEKANSFWNQGSNQRSNERLLQ